MKSAFVVQWLGLRSIDQKVMGLNGVTCLGVPLVKLEYPTSLSITN